MRVIGIVGGMGPEASLYYYRLLIDINREAQKTMNPNVGWIIYNANPRASGPNRQPAPVEMQTISGSAPPRRRMFESPDRLLYAIECLQRARADFAIIACNTAHTIFNEVSARSALPLLSIVEETYKEVQRRGLRKVGLFGSQVTMEGTFYQEVFNHHNIPIVIPNPEERAYIDGKVFGELVPGIIRSETRKEFLRIAQRMIDEESIEGLILGCTEIPLLLTKDELGIPFLDTSRIHAESAFSYALTLPDT